MNIKWKEKMKPGISMITFCVNDLEKSIKFYYEGLGFPKMELSPEVAFNPFFLVGPWMKMNDKLIKF